MSTRATTPTAADLAEEASAWAVGGGIITMALFPLALPILLLTAAAVIPLLLLGLAVASVVGVVAGPLMLLRRLRQTSRFPVCPQSVPNVANPAIRSDP